MSGRYSGRLTGAWICPPGISVCHAAIVENWLLGLVLRRSVSALAGDPCVSGRYSGRLAGAWICLPGISVCPAAIVVVLPGAWIICRDQCVSCRYSETGYLAWSYGDRCVCWPGILACQAAIVVVLPGRGSAYQGSVCVRLL